MSGAIVGEVMIGLVEAQLGGREVTAGRNWPTMAVNLDPKRKEGARTKTLLAKKMTVRRRIRICEGIARLEVEQAHRLIFIYIKLVFWRSARVRVCGQKYGRCGW